MHLDMMFLFFGYPLTFFQLSEFFFPKINSIISRWMGVDLINYYTINLYYAGG